MAPATRPAPLMPALKVRRDQLLLRQIATCGGAWTDGQTIYEGPALDRLRRETVNRLIRNQAATAGQAAHLPSWGKRPHEYSNLAVLQRMSRRQDQIPQSLPDWMLSIALRSRRDPVGESRGICALRILRRQFPEHALELARRMAPPTAQVEARMPILQREGAVLVRDVTFQGTTVPKGTAVESLGASSGYVTVHYGAYGVIIEIPLADMRAMTDADRKRLERAEVARGQPAPDVETDSPSP